MAIIIFYFIGSSECNDDLNYYPCAVPDVPCPADSLPPPGLQLLEDFISDEYEQRLLDVIDWQQLSGSFLLSSQKLLLIVSLFGFSLNSQEKMN